MRRPTLLPIALALSALVALGLGTTRSQAAAETRYLLQDLGAGIPDYQIQGRGVNNLGQVAGYNKQPFLWTEGSGMTLLPTFGGVFGTGNALNDQGLMVGSADVRNGSDRAFLYDGTRLLDLTGKNGSVAYAINASNQVAGAANYKGFIWQNGKVTYLPVLKSGAAAGALTINDGGLVAGYGYTALGASEYLPVYWSGGKIYPLPVLSNDNRRGQVIGSNNANDLVGWAAAPVGGGRFESRAVLWRGGAAVDLGTLNGTYSRAFDINNSGQIVGRAGIQTTPTSETFYAMFWSDANGNGISDPGEMVNLNERLDPGTGAGWLLYEAASINDQGQITGWGIRDGAIRAFLLTPAP